MSAPAKEPLQQPLSEELVRMAYLMLLGREVESEAALKAHMGLPDVGALRRVILASPEFRERVLNRQLPPAAKWVATDVLGQFTMWVDLHDRYVSNGCLSGGWEPSESSYATAHLTAGNVMLDIGANIGWFTLLGAKCTAPGGQVHAFEPRPDTFAMLRRTIADNELSEAVTLYDVALSDRAGSVSLQWERATDNPGHTFFAARGGEADGSRFESVAARTVVLDELLPEVAPDFVKIDVEGAEPLALAGARNALMRRRPPILSELYPEQLESVSGLTPPAFIAQLAELGYACYLLEDGLPTRRLHDFPGDATRELVSVVFEAEPAVRG
jgi:FkbM family methyltransferase